MVFKEIQVQINPAKVQNRSEQEYSGINPERVLMITQSLGIPRQIKVKHNVFRSLVRRRAGWVTETVKVYAVCNASGSVKESVQEGL